MIMSHTSFKCQKVMRESLNYSNTFCLRFDFGLPLEDISPPDDIHPKLKCIFLIGYDALRKCDGSVDEILRDLQDALHERLKIKEEFVRTQQIPSNGILPGTFLWLIRHFLGSLPLPLLPSITCDRTYDWISYSSKCKHHYRNLSKEDELDLSCNLSRIISDLPNHHVILLHTLVIFLRSLCMTKSYPTKISRKSLSCLVKYYTASIFLRPYQPGYVIEKEKHFYALFYFMIAKWFWILKDIKSKSCPGIWMNSKSDSDFLQSYYTHSNLNVFKEKSHTSTQTEYNQPSSIVDQLNFINSLSIMPSNHTTISERKSLKNSSSQTDPEYQIGWLKVQPYGNKKRHNHVRGESRKTKRIEILDEDDEAVLSHLSEEIEIKTIEYEGSEDSPINVHKSLPKDENNSGERNLGWIKPKISITNDESRFIYDDYDTFQTEKYNQISTKTYYNIAGFNVENDLKLSPNSQDDTNDHEENHQNKGNSEKTHDSPPYSASINCEEETCSSKNDGNVSEQKSSPRDVLLDTVRNIGWRYVPSVPVRTEKRYKRQSSSEDVLEYQECTVNKDYTDDTGDPSVSENDVPDRKKSFQKKKPPQDFENYPVVLKKYFKEENSTSEIYEEPPKLEKCLNEMKTFDQNRNFTNRSDSPTMSLRERFNKDYITYETNENQCNTEKHVSEMKVLGLNYWMSKFRLLKRLRRSLLSHISSHHSSSSVKYKRMIQKKNE